MAHRPAPKPAARCAQHEIRVVEATAQTLAGYGRIERDFPSARIEIVRWPAQGWRPVDDDTGDQGGTTEGTFAFHWKGEVLYGRNDAVGDSYLIGWSAIPAKPPRKSDSNPNFAAILALAALHGRRQQPKREAASSSRAHLKSNPDPD